jgi:hypothetical protein
MMMIVGNRGWRVMRGSLMDFRIVEFSGISQGVQARYQICVWNGKHVLVHYFRLVVNHFLDYA